MLNDGLKAKQRSWILLFGWSRFVSAYVVLGGGAVCFTKWVLTVSKKTRHCILPLLVPSFLVNYFWSFWRWWGVSAGASSLLWCALLESMLMTLNVIWDAGFNLWSLKSLLSCSACWQAFVFYFSSFNRSFSSLFFVFSVFMFVLVLSSLCMNSRLT